MNVATRHGHLPILIRRSSSARKLRQYNAFCEGFSKPSSACQEAAYVCASNLFDSRSLARFFPPEPWPQVYPGVVRTYVRGARAAAACERRAAAAGWQVPAEPTMPRLNSQVLGF